MTRTARILLGRSSFACFAWMFVACGSTRSVETPPKSSASASASVPAPAPAWSEASFNEQLRVEIGRRFPGASIAPHGVNGYRIERSKDSVLEVQFDKALASCREDWSTCQRAVDHTLGAVAEVSTSTAITPAQLRIVLRSNDKVDAARERAKVFVKPFAPDASWLLAADLPRTIRLDVMPDEIGLTAEQAWTTALDNMKVAPSALVTDANTMFIVYEGLYAPSALLAAPVLEQVARAQYPGRAGKLLAVSPEENILLYTIGSSAQIAALRSVVGDPSHEPDNPLSKQVMEWTGKTWRAAP